MWLAFAARYRKRSCAYRRACGPVHENEIGFEHVCYRLTPVKVPTSFTVCSSVADTPSIAEGIGGGGGEGGGEQQQQQQRIDCVIHHYTQ